MRLLTSYHECFWKGCCNTFISHFLLWSQSEFIYFGHSKLRKKSNMCISGCSKIKSCTFWPYVRVTVWVQALCWQTYSKIEYIVILQRFTTVSPKGDRFCHLQTVMEVLFRPGETTIYPHMHNFTTAKHNSQIDSNVQISQPTHAEFSRNLDQLLQRGSICAARQWPL